MNYMSPNKQISSFSDLMRYPFTKPLHFTLKRPYGVMTAEAFLVHLFDLPEGEISDGGACLWNKFLDPSDRKLCAHSFAAILEGHQDWCRHYGRMLIFGEVFWVVIKAKVLSTHATSQVIDGTIEIFDFHRILSEFMAHSDCVIRNRQTLSNFASVSIDAEAVLLDFKELPCEPDVLCQQLKLARSDILFAEPFFDGAILCAFKGERAPFEETVSLLANKGQINKERSFYSNRSHCFEEALALRAEFMRRLSPHVPFRSGLSLADMVNLTMATRANFSGFCLYFQPQVDQSDFCGGEFLLRLKDATPTSPGPDVFIPIIEKTELVQPFGRWTTEQTLEHTATLAEKMKPGFTVSFNMSAAQADDAGFVPFVKRTLIRNKIPAHHLMVELTETFQIRELSALRLQIEELRTLGVQTAVDDFGTGYNSIEVLFKVPFDTVKFSREFIWEVLKDPTRQRFYKKLIDACHEMGVDVCAEGVETLEMYNALRELGVDMFQGYYFARPMPIEDAVIAVKQCDALRPKENL